MQTDQLQDTGIQEENANIEAYDSGFDSIDDSGVAIITEQPELEEENKNEVVPENEQIDEEVPEEFRNTQHYKSMFGRIEKERLEKEALKEKLKGIEASQRQLTQQQQQRPVFEKAEIPEEIKEDIAEFKKQFPEYGDLIELKGKEGDRLRSLLTEYGANFASVQAENLVVRIEAARAKQDLSRQMADQIAIGHEQQIYAAHPDFAEMDNTSKVKFFEDLSRWIEDQPGREYREWDRIFNSGSTKETIRLFEAFKQSRSQTKPNESSAAKNKRSQAIEEGLAVKTGARHINPSRKADLGDFGGGWNSIPD